MNEKSTAIVKALEDTMGLTAAQIKERVGFNVTGGTLGNMRRAGLIVQVDGLWRVARSHLVKMYGKPDESELAAARERRGSGE